MSGERPCEQPVPTCWRRFPREEYHSLDSESYTAQRLQHASPEHLHVTSRRLFIGPLPKGWLSSHRKSWYKSWLGLKDYSSRTATFSADINLAHQRQLTGLFGPSTAAMYRQSFPQPEDVDEEAEEEELVATGATVEPAAITTADTAHETPYRYGPEPAQEPPPEPTSELTAEHSQLSTVTPTSTSQPQPASVSSKSDPDSNPPSSSQIHESYYSAPESHKNASRILSATSPISEESLESGNYGVNENTESTRVISRRMSPHGQSLTPSIPSATGETASRTNFTSQTYLLSGRKSINDRSPSILSSPRLRHEEPSLVEQEDSRNKSRPRRLMRRLAPGIVRFNIEDSINDRQRRLQKRLTRTASELESTAKKQRQASRCGAIVRAERMLVRIESTTQTVPDDYNENESIKIDTKVVSKWREFLVVCREGCEDDTPFLLQFYKTRVIPQVQTSDMKKKWSYEIPIVRSHTKVNLFSTLDKTLVVWHRFKPETQIFIMRPRSSAHSVEWYTFIRGALGWKQPSILFVHVPDLDITLRLENPFAHLGMNQNEDDDVCSAVLRTMKEERAIASGIIKTCLNTLSECSEWNKILAMWGKSAKMGLAWRRYDRLEWVQGPNEQRMYGTMAMRTTHELELRPKQHYPTSTTLQKGGPKVEEPAPTEGFLILLTSQRGRQRLIGKNFFKRLYFYTQDQFLCFCKPGKATPPAPPSLPTITSRNIPTSAEIIRETPIVYDVDPFPVNNGKVTWLTVGRKEYAKSHDAEAFAENRRITKNAANTEGYINMCRVAEIRPVSSQTSQEEQHANAGDVEYHGERGKAVHGARHETKEDRSFEIVLDDGLVVLFRTYNMQTRQEWIRRLTELSDYWKARTKKDIATLKYIRSRNLKRLEIDEAQESMLGQFAQKWEVSRAEASSELFHACGMSGCRPIKMSGNLYRKPRRHGAFTHCSVLLIEGQLLIFQSSLRRWTGEQFPHIYRSRQAVLDLRDCYIYSGIITSSDLLYQQQTFDSNLPSQLERPRMYTQDGWTASDEDIATCFVIWHATRKALFRGELTKKGKPKRSGWKQVSALGVPGKAIVFKARSRAERDLWVLAIATEIDRLQQQEDLRIVKSPCI
ncbi:PH domain containing protein [Coccidioides posadasii C735 delta SOWgp]|uniref:PH domain containing protein n=1 Tax=Coccidioides posadasii (strain C735) TaxID=222929 RepID=C5PF94_COCP7|nr:PH domain containing protein [Coccidioides posadasii C735 delta SOWgp]EER24674.1 PH domain containing protein [Coccidioides posadasii C735 delta SOWgp]|eukprot:XP_003066819.1 PH domain containing protein [Coccidioides posadasii C735 delta SOWgp]